MWLPLPSGRSRRLSEAVLLAPGIGDWHRSSIGRVLRSKVRSNPLFISPGHRIDLDSSVRVVQDALNGYRLPEPTRQAHNYVNALRRGDLT